MDNKSKDANTTPSVPGSEGASSPQETPLQWGNSSTFVPGRGWITLPQPLPSRSPLTDSFVLTPTNPEISGIGDTPLEEGVRTVVNQPSASFEGIAQRLLELKKLMDALEAENRVLRSNIANLHSHYGSDTVSLRGDIKNTFYTPSYLEQQITLVHNLLRSLVGNVQNAEAIADALGTSTQEIMLWMTGVVMPTEQMQNRLWELYLEQVHNDQTQVAEGRIQVHILEEPLTLSTLTTALTALTELSTKCWLIAQGRFADLFEYTQTHDERFVREAGVTISKVSHNSPFNIDINLNAANVAEAVTTTIDGIFQTRSRLVQKELEVLSQAQTLEQAAQQAEHEQQMAALEREKQKLTIEQQRLEILEKRLDLQKKAVEHSLELAGTVVDSLQPGLDAAARAMAIQAILPNILQLQNVAGLAIALPSVQKDKKGDEPSENNRDHSKTEL